MAPRVTSCRVANDAVHRDVEAVKRGGLRQFVARAWHVVDPGHPDFVDNFHVEAICAELEYGKGPVAINLPPGLGKSFIISVIFPVYVWLFKPAAHILTLCHDGNTGEDFARKSKMLILSEWYQDRWGGKYELNAYSADGDYLNSAEGRRLALSMGQKPTGRRFDYIILDDPEPGQPTEAYLDANYRFMTGALSTRLHTGGRVICVQQRVATGDTTSTLLSFGARNLVFRMYAEEDDPDRHPLDRRAPGELLFPAVRGEAEVESIRAQLITAQNISAQLQQRPVPEGGTLFKLEWLKTWTALPRTFDAIAIGVDVASTTGAKSDYTVAAVIGRKKEFYYVLDVYRARAEINDVEAAVRELKKQYPRAELVIEQASSGIALSQILKRKNIRVNEVKATKSKKFRAEAILPILAGGGFFLPPHAAWLADVIRELLAFPIAGEHDDIVDAVVHALNYLAEHAGSGNLAAAMQAMAKDPTWRTGNPFS